MRKLLVAVSFVCAVAFARADVTWSWWMNRENATTDFSFGIASKCAAVDTFEFSVLYSASPVRDGVQWTFFGLNDSDADCALQLAFFNRGNDPCVQLGLINIANDPVLDLGFVNVADDAKFQIGLLNFNKSGFLPVFVFVNFNPSIFTE